QVNLEENAAPVAWQPVTADSANRFIVRSRSGGYIYLTYNSDKERTALLNVIGNYKVLVNGEPHMGDVNQSGWLLIPIKLKKGLNEFYISGLFFRASLSFPNKQVLFNTADPTLPSIVLNGDRNNLQGAVTVINNSPKEIKSWQIKSKLLGQ